MMMFMMMESQLQFLRFSFLLVCSTALPAFTAAQPSSGSNSSQQDDESLDSATMAILVLVVVSAILFLGSFSLWIQNCCVGSGRPYRRSRSFRSTISFGSGSRFRQSGQDRDSLAESTAGVDKAVIDTFPLMMYSAAKEMKIGVRSLECAVCLSEFSDEELLRLLPSCDHVFHPQCIATWLANHATCPVCRARVIDNRRSPIKKEGNIPLATAINSEDSIPDEAAGDQNSASVSQSSRDNERFALKLPEGVKEQIVKAARLKLKRSASCEHLPGVWSCRRSGARSDSGECSGSQIGRWLGRSERWGSSVVPSDCLAVKGDDDRFAILPV